jgi:hypothetical protein
LATFCLTFLPLNIGMLCSSPIDILHGVINGFYSCGLLVWLATNSLQELVASCSQNPNWRFVSLWHILFSCTLFFNAQYPTLTI